MNNNNNNGRGIFYGVIGVATLVVAIIGATFAYFTATANETSNITGNAASISFSLAVEKVSTADATDGLIPMSNSMIEPAVSNAANKGVCVDKNGNPVCQVYKISITNNSTASAFVDGWVALSGGSGKDATDYANKNNKTDMRWAQVFAGSGSAYTTAGTQTLLAGSPAVAHTYEALVPSTPNSGNGKNVENIKTNSTDILDTNSEIKINYIRVSDDNVGTDGYAATTAFNRANYLTSALVYNQNIPGGGTQEFYIVIWLSESGIDQTLEAGTENQFFSGVVKFDSAGGSGVSAEFTGYASTAKANG